MKQLDNNIGKSYYYERKSEEKIIRDSNKIR